MNRVNKFRKTQDDIETTCINRNFKTPSMIQIKSTLKTFICLFVRFYLFLKLQFLLGFLIPWISSVYLYCVCQILVFSAINTTVTDM